MFGTSRKDKIQNEKVMELTNWENDKNNKDPLIKLFWTRDETPKQVWYFVSKNRKV